MNKKESNKVNSFRTTEEVMNRNQNIWSKSTRAAALFALITGKLKLVSVYDKKKNSKQPSSLLKKDQKEKVAGMAVKISKSAIDYAAGKNDLVLEFQAKISKSELLKMKENSLLTALKKLYDLVVPFQAELTHLDKSDIANFKAMLDSFDKAMPHPQAQMDESKTATHNLKSLIGEINTMFITLDKHIGPFEYTQPDFFSDYTNSRIVKDMKKKGPEKKAAAA